MKILVSACLMGINCKYSGGNNFSEKLAAYADKCEMIPVCPEILGGLPVPRIPCEITDGEVCRKDGVSCDREYRLGARKALEIAKRKQVGFAVLQPRSPSCGVHQVYDGTFSGTLKDGQGVFARLMTENGFRILEPDELRPEDFN